ncbi:transcriptional regulator, RpiR family [Carnobacterium alterfunditum]|uniref:Transcriptional regulator, RpiR family n=1 Tax=Carnobacterium alterfunditum TaxID=28230 RepID=A0A1N6HGY3_9LACT|nr:MurR/RpiR family transcriptional regulator [Carnobacterium alterfunditum]SIO18929.1 transcriptional regulator, RpiR family [Carnobacterium alterfunditum]
MSYNYLEKLLRPYMKGFNDTENIIADHFIKLGNEVVNKTLSNLADDTGLSEATIFKFVKKIGFDGFPNFKISVASNFRTMEERKNELAVFSDISKEDSSYTIAQKLVYSNKLALDNLGESLDEKKINQALDLMYDSKTLHFFGQGASSVIALDSYHKFLRTGVYCNYISDYHMQLSYATKLGPNDCVFLFSHSGETIETIEVAKILCANHVKIIVLTGNHYTDLVKLSTVAFIVDSEESVFQSETLTSRILYMTIIDILYVALMYHDEAKNKESLEKIRKALVITKKRRPLR